MFNVNSDKFAEQVEALHERVDALLHRAQSELPQQPRLLTEAFLELHTTLEELRVSQEELYQRNQELETTRAALETERQRYQELFEEAPDGYIVTDEQGNIREANIASAKLLNIEKKYLLCKPLIVFTNYAIAIS